MSKHDQRVRLQHMLDAAREAVSLTQGRTRFDLDTDRLLNLGLVRLLEIIGEAANRVSDEDYGLYPEIPWGQIVSCAIALSMVMTMSTLISSGVLFRMTCQI